MEFLFLFYRYLPYQPPTFAGRLFINPFKPDPSVFLLQTYRYQSPAHAGLWGGHARSGAERTTYGSNSRSFILFPSKLSEIIPSLAVDLPCVDLPCDVTSGSHASIKCLRNSKETSLRLCAFIAITRIAALMGVFM